MFSNTALRDQREVVVVGDVAQCLRGSVGAVLLGRRAGERFGIGARLALHAAEQRDLVMDAVDNDRRLPTLLQFVQFLLTPLDVVEIFPVTLGKLDFVLAREFRFLEPANQPVVQVIEVARILVATRREVGDGRRLVRAAWLVDVDVDSSVAHGEWMVMPDDDDAMLETFNYGLARLAELLKALGVKDGERPTKVQTDLAIMLPLAEGLARCLTLTAGQILADHRKLTRLKKRRQH